MYINVFQSRIAFRAIKNLYSNHVAYRKLSKTCIRAVRLEIHEFFFFHNTPSEFSMQIISEKSPPSAPSSSRFIRYTRLYALQLRL